MRSSSFQSIDVSMSREVQSAYDDIKTVAAVTDSIKEVADLATQQGVNFPLLSQVLINLGDATSEHLATLAALNLDEITADLDKGSYLGNRKIDIDLALNVQGITFDMLTDNPQAAEDLWVAASQDIMYDSATITFEDGDVVELPFLSDNNPTVVTNSDGLLVQFNRTDVVAAVQQEDVIYSFDVLDNTTYVVEIDNVDYSYTTATGATRGEIVTGLSNQINVGTEPWTAHNNIDTITIVADIPGNDFVARVSDNLLIRTDVANVRAGNYPTAFLNKLESTSFNSFTVDSVSNIIRFFDVIGQNSNIERIRLHTTSSSSNYKDANPVYYWGETTSSLEVLSMRVADIINLGLNIDNIVQISGHLNQLLELQDRIPEFIDTYIDGNPRGDVTIYNKLVELDIIYQKLAELITIYNDLKADGTHYVESVATDLQTNNYVTTLGVDLQDTNSKVTEVGVDLQTNDYISSVGTDLQDASSKVTEVGTDLQAIDSKIREVANNLQTTATIDTVAADIANVNTTAGSITSVNTTAASIAGVNITASNITDVNTTAGSIDSVNTTATNIADVNIVAAHIGNVDTVAADITSVITVANDKVNIDAVNANKDNIDSVKANEANITTVAGKINDLSINKVVAEIDNGDIPTIVTKVDDGTLDTLTANIPNLTNIHDNLAEILLADNNAAAAAASASNASAYAVTAQNYAESMHSLTASALTLTPDSTASVTYDSGNNNLVLGIPKGPQGDRGAAFNVDATGALAARTNYDDQPKGYAFLATDTGNLYIKNSATSADWSPAIPFGKGDTGAVGNGIASITFTGTTDPSGSPYKLNALDTYTVMYTDGSTFTYNVANGYGQTYTTIVEDYVASDKDFLLCDSKARKQKVLLTNIQVEAGSTYEVTVDNVSAPYTSDAITSQINEIKDITVTNGLTYTMAINSSEVSYTADSLIKQKNSLTIDNVLDNTTYTVDIGGVVSSYTSDAAIKQKDTINSIDVQDGYLYRIDINGTTIGYTSDALTAQVDQITNIIAANSTNYTVTINGNTVTYTSDTDATVIEIRDGLIAAINNDSNTNVLVTATANGNDIDVTAVTGGLQFTMTQDSGNMSANTAVQANYATSAEIIIGLVNAINNDPTLGAIVTAELVTVTEFTVTSNTAGVPFTLSVVSGTMSTATTVANNNAVLSEILAGLINAINTSSAPVTATLGTDKVVVEADVGGVPFTLTPGANSSTVVDVITDDATLTEVIQGLTTAINNSAEAVTATAKPTSIEVKADAQDGTFTLTAVNGTMNITTVTALEKIVNGIKDSINSLGNSNIVTSIVNSDIIVEAAVEGVGYNIALVQGSMNLSTAQINQTGVSTVTLPNLPGDGAVVTIMDVTGTFDTDPITVIRNGGLIMGLAEDMVINTKQAKVEMINVNNDWRFA